MDAFWIIFLLAIGACIGSFLNVVIYRLPKGESIVFPPSHCPSCGRNINWYDNIPIISFFLLKGKCRNCGVKISPQYAIIEATAAILITGLYVCYFVLDLRDNAGDISTSWPMFIAHAGLICGLLVCSVVDIKQWIIPLEVMWVCSILGIASAAYRPHPFIPMVSPVTIAVSFAAVIGIVVAIILMRLGYIQPSFIDAEDKPPFGEKEESRGVAITKDHGVNPRKEILRELLFLSPAIILAIAANVVLRFVPSAWYFWSGLFDSEVHPKLAMHLTGCGSAVFGYLIGGLWIWGIRIFGTLVFGKEAMGLGDAHILAGVGAVLGWLAPSIVFFLAPFFGLAWALYLWIGKKQRELPYGPWLAAATVVIMIFYDGFEHLINQYLDTVKFLFE